MSAVFLFTLFGASHPARASPPRYEKYTKDVCEGEVMKASPFNYEAYCQFNGEGRDPQCVKAAGDLPEKERLPAIKRCCQNDGSKLGRERIPLPDDGTTCAVRCPEGQMADPGRDYKVCTNKTPPPPTPTVTCDATKHEVLNADRTACKCATGYRRVDKDCTKIEQPAPVDNADTSPPSPEDEDPVLDEDPPPQAPCPDGQERVDGQCPPPCNGLRDAKGVCQIDCGQSFFAETQERCDALLAEVTKNLPCPNGQDRISGQCVPACKGLRDAKGECQIDCGNSRHAKDKKGCKALLATDQNHSCPDGQERINGQCVDSLTPWWKDTEFILVMLFVFFVLIVVVITLVFLFIIIPRRRRKLQEARDHVARVRLVVTSNRIAVEQQIEKLKRAQLRLSAALQASNVDPKWVDRQQKIADTLLGLLNDELAHQGAAINQLDNIEGILKDASNPVADLRAYEKWKELSTNGLGFVPTGLLEVPLPGDKPKDEGQQPSPTAEAPQPAKAPEAQPKPEAKLAPEAKSAKPAKVQGLEEPAGVQGEGQRLADMAENDADREALAKFQSEHAAKTAVKATTTKPDTVKPDTQPQAAAKLVATPASPPSGGSKGSARVILKSAKPAEKAPEDLVPRGTEAKEGRSHQPGLSTLVNQAMLGKGSSQLPPPTAAREMTLPAVRPDENQTPAGGTVPLVTTSGEAVSGVIADTGDEGSKTGAFASNKVQPAPKAEPRSPPPPPSRSALPTRKPPSPGASGVFQAPPPEFKPGDIRDDDEKPSGK